MDINRITEALAVNIDKKLDCVLPCYKIDDHHYIVFWNELVHKDDIEVILHWVDDHKKLYTSSKRIGMFSEIRCCESDSLLRYSLFKNEHIG